MAGITKRFATFAAILGKGQNRLPPPTNRQNIHTNTDHDEKNVAHAGPDDRDDSKRDGTEKG